MFGWFRDITTNAKTNHVVALDLFKALSFFAGLFYFLLLVPTVILVTPSHLVLPMEPGFFLTANGFGLQVVKEGAKYLARKTADDQGNPLATPTSVEPPCEPKLMPQVP
ncbi:hypothetical protein GCM10011383_42340 [Hymenobacter cavernae]|uniref:Uncharacterized protein n=1 Tax=Hymenobacter cavernae TaxID=2044852 RepID=A0ABQ1UV93_9BACT|nr:hypothetical protein GCM10011383_42340 [Hymenobacter cavernae]